MNEQTQQAKTIMRLESKIKHLEEEVTKYKFDFLTGLPMRIDFESTFDRFMQDYKSFNKTFVLGIVDVNDLHNINFEHGYLMGDSVILSVAKIVSEKLCDSNIFRIGGDEFAILCRIEDVDSIYSKLSEEHIDSPITTGAVIVDETMDCSSMFARVDKIMKSKKSSSPRYSHKTINK